MTITWKRTRHLVIALITTTVLGCSPHINKIRADLESRDDTVSSFQELEFKTLALNESEKIGIGNPLPVMRTAYGNGFALPLEIPAEAKSIYFRLVLKGSDSANSHIVYPAFVFLDVNSNEISRVEPEVEAVWDMSFDGMYFDGTIAIPQESTRIVALFSPKYFGREITYDATGHYGAMIGSVPVTWSTKSDAGVPVVEGGPFRIEFKSEEIASIE
jgi:hypothetical protein